MRKFQVICSKVGEVFHKERDSITFIMNVPDKATLFDVKRQAKKELHCFHENYEKTSFDLYETYKIEEII